MTLTYMVSCTPVSLTMIAFVPLCYNTVISDGEIYVVVIIKGNADIFGNGDFAHLFSFCLRCDVFPRIYYPLQLKVHL